MSPRKGKEKVVKVPKASTEQSASKDAQQQRSFKDRLPSIAGWCSEYNTFRILLRACNLSLRTNGRNMGLIRGPSHAATDGGLVIDPPPGFPFHDAKAAWHWARKRCDDSTPVQILRFDAKLNLSSPKPGQWAPFFIVIVPDFPQYLCVMPIRSYHNAFNVHRRTRRYYDQHQPSPKSQEDLVFPDYLAPFAVHRDDICEALESLVNASLDKTCYVNPTTGVEFRGWVVPEVETSIQSLFAVQQKEQEASRIAIERFANFLESVPGMDIVLNPIDPLICDLILIDETDRVSYHIEHKYLTPGTRGSGTLHEIPLRSKDPKMNWHFLIHQSGEHLAIHTRSGTAEAPSNPANARIIDMSNPTSTSEFASIIRANGPIAISRLRSKWRKIDMYDPEVINDSKGAVKEPNDDSFKDATMTRGKPASEIRLFGLAFRDRINEQCYKLKRNACVLLHNHPCGNAAIVEHDWLDEEIRLYETAGLLPVSLANKTAVEKKCVLIRFIPHRQSTNSPSTSQLLELAMQYSFEVPTCSAQDVIYVADTGGIFTPGQRPKLENVVLLPSKQATIWTSDEGCQKCDYAEYERHWTTQQLRVHAKELPMVGGSRGSFSLTHHPILRSNAEPLKNIHDLEDGAVNEYFDAMFSEEQNDYVTTIGGPSGLLQRQWNHGDIREQSETGDHPSDKLLRRVLVTLEFYHLKEASAYLSKEKLDHKIEKTAKEKKISPTVAKKHALCHLIDNEGSSLRALVALAGFPTTTSGLHCDHCTDESSCKFLLTDQSLDSNFCCGGCYAKKIANTLTGGCTIRRMPLALMQELGTFEPFRTHVPCNNCWDNGTICDNKSDSCDNCLRDGTTCVREACALFNEPRDDSFCRDCDKAHHDDGYRNVAAAKRGGTGYNAKKATREAPHQNDSRIAVCSECWAHNGDDLCTNDDICSPCATRINNGEKISCQRIACQDFGACSKKNCTLAHAGQEFPAENLIEYVKKRPRRLQGKEKISVYM